MSDAIAKQDGQARVGEGVNGSWTRGALLKAALRKVGSGRVLAPEVSSVAGESVVRGCSDSF